MKLIFVLVLLSTSALATEIETECPAMNQSREKIVKQVSIKKMRNGSRVVGQ